jgi:hypothetical protein
MSRSEALHDEAEVVRPEAQMSAVVEFAAPAELDAGRRTWLHCSGTSRSWAEHDRDGGVVEQRRGSGDFMDALAEGAVRTVAVVAWRGSA